MAKPQNTKRQRIVLIAREGNQSVSQTLYEVDAKRALAAAVAGVVKVFPKCLVK